MIVCCILSACATTSTQAAAGTIDPVPPHPIWFFLLGAISNLKFIQAVYWMLVVISALLWERLDIRGLR